MTGTLGIARYTAVSNPRILFPLLMAVGWLTGCATTNPITKDRTSLIVPGKTTIAETRQILGSPDEIERHEDMTMLRYRYMGSLEMTETGSRGRLHTWTFDALADAGGVVQKTHAAEHSVSIRSSEARGVVSGAELSEEKIAQIETGTPVAKLLELFGPPHVEQLWWDGTIVRSWFDLSTPRNTLGGKGKVLSVEFDDQDNVFSFSTNEEPLK